MDNVIFKFRKSFLFCYSLLLMVFVPVTIYAYSQSGANTFSCTSLSDCQNAINAASDGNVITLTQNASFSSSLSINKGVHLKGASGSITISGSASPLISITRDATHSVEISTLSITGSALTVSGSGKPPLIHDITFTHAGSSSIIVFYSNGGVVYDNTFTCPDTWEGMYGIQFVDTGNLSDWQTASTMGADDTNGNRNTYIEGNTFNDFVTNVFDNDDSSRVVARYNTFNNSAVSSHGFCSSVIGNRHWEFINNDFNYVEYKTNRGNVGNGWLKMRGGTGVITGNEFDDVGSYWGPKPIITLSVWAVGSGENCGQYPSGCCSSYPCTRQVGQGHNGSNYITEPVYIWSNTNGKMGKDGNGSPCGGLSVDDVLTQNTDYYLTSKGGYTQYTCPHPLAGTGTCSGVGASGYKVTGNDGTTVPPTDLRVVQ